MATQNPALNSQQVAPVSRLVLVGRWVGFPSTFSYQHCVLPLFVSEPCFGLRLAVGCSFSNHSLSPLAALAKLGKY